MDQQGVDRLFTLPLAEFVAARNDLAKSLKTSGEKETAARIQKLPKPSISAWAINQLVRADHALLEALLAALDRQRTLQLSGIGGGVDRGEMKEAKQAENETIGRMERALVPILEAGGHASGRTAIERCVRSIRAAAVHPEGRPLLENGHLTIDFDAPGFDALSAGLASVETAQSPPKLRLISSAIEEKRRLEETRAFEQQQRDERRQALQRERIEVQAKLDQERRKLEEERRRLDDEKRLEDERRREAERGIEQERRAAELERSKQNARLGEAAKILGSLRLERARLEEQAIQIADQVERARVALERIQREASRAEQELAQKTEQITQLEQLLGLFDDQDEEDEG